MKAGALTERIILQSATISRDGEGAPVETWSNFAEVWANVRPLSARQIAQAAQTDAAVRKSVMIRWLSGVTSAMRVLFADGSAAKVSWVEEDRRQDWMIVVVEDFNG